jgi:hypothetical protein
MLGLLYNEIIKCSVLEPHYPYAAPALGKN